MDRIVRWLLVALLLVIGGTMLVGGIILIVNSGSPYYLLAGLAVLATALALAARRPSAVIIYAVFLAATILWSVWESGLDGWALVPRLIGPAVVALCFLAGPIHRSCGMRSRWWIGGPVIAIALIIGAAAMMPDGTQNGPAAATKPMATTASGGEWRNWGNGVAGTRYAPIAQINTQNVTRLELAWRYNSGLSPLSGSSFQGTPLAVDGRLYVCVGHDVVVALDQETGQEVWRFDAKTNFAKIIGSKCRGVAYYEADHPLPECQKRILFGTADARLIGLDAESGRPCASFADGGAVDLRAGLGDFPPGAAMPTSPPTIVNGVVVVGQFVSDFLSIDAPSGVIRGYDAVTGMLRWAWDAGREDRTTAPPPGEVYTRATPNAWTAFSGDEQLGLVFVPTGNSLPDYFGGQRIPESEKYSSSVVAIDVATGKVRWSFQTVHHDLWDYDLPAQPVAVDLSSPAGAVPALIVPTKRGELFVLDRRDGHSIDPIEERAVPQGAVEGDWVSKTQPYSKGFPSVAGADLREADMWGITPLDQLWCRIRFKKAHYEGQFTPPSLRPTIYYPGSVGGSNWGSVTVDTDRGLMIANTNHMPNIGRLVPRQEADRTNAALLLGGGAYTYPQAKTPYAFAKAPFMSPLLMPCQQPPYGRISVFDINTRQVVWSKPFGTAAGSGPFGLQTKLPIPMGVPNMGGSVATGGGLVFIGAAQDRLLRAYDITTGRELWHVDLPAAGAATPMTYVSPRSGRQFVVIAAGGHFAIPGPTSDALLAYALPRQN